jgi:hypothetical protein
MKKVGESVQETIEAMESGALDAAFAATCNAIETTLKKSLETEDLTSGDYQNFVKQNWRLLVFMGLPQALPMPLDVEFGLSRLVHGFNLKGAEETVFHLVRQTATMGRIPAQFKFHHGGAFEIKNDKIFVPAVLIGGLIGIVIFHPTNKNESVPDKYWLNISDFKMFISELWGRKDLAERIVDFYNG